MPAIRYAVPAVPNPTKKLALVLNCSAHCTDVDALCQGALTGDLND